MKRLILLTLLLISSLVMFSQEDVYWKKIFHEGIDVYDSLDAPKIVTDSILIREVTSLPTSFTRHGLVIYNDSLRLWNGTLWVNLQEGEAALFEMDGDTLKPISANKLKADSIFTNYLKVNGNLIISNNVEADTGKFNHVSGKLIYTYETADRTIYIDSTSGNDNNTGELGSPVKTISGALSKVADNLGNHILTLKIDSGSYNYTKADNDKINELTKNGYVLPIGHIDTIGTSFTLTANLADPFGYNCGTQGWTTDEHDGRFLSISDVLYPISGNTSDTIYSIDDLSGTAYIVEVKTKFINSENLLYWVGATDAVAGLYFNPKRINFFSNNDWFFFGQGVPEECIFSGNYEIDIKGKTDEIGLVRCIAHLTHPDNLEIQSVVWKIEQCYVTGTTTGLLRSKVKDCVVRGGIFKGNGTNSGMFAAGENGLYNTNNSSNGGKGFKGINLDALVHLDASTFKNPAINDIYLENVNYLIDINNTYDINVQISETVNLPDIAMTNVTTFVDPEKNYFVNVPDNVAQIEVVGDTVKHKLTKTGKLYVVGDTLFLGNDTIVAGASIKMRILRLTDSITIRDSTLEQLIAARTSGGGIITLENGGLGEDVSAYDGLVKISGSDASYITDNSTNWNTAYTHSQLTSGNPHSVALSDFSVTSTSTELNYLDGYVPTNIQIAVGDGSKLTSSSNFTWSSGSLITKSTTGGVTNYIDRLNTSSSGILNFRTNSFDKAYIGLMSDATDNLHIGDNYGDAIEFKTSIVELKRSFDVLNDLTAGTISSDAGVNIATGNDYSINSTSVLNATTLGTSVTTSSLTTVGTINSGVWNGTALTAGYVPNHDALNGFEANEHFTQTSISNVSTALSTGLLKVTTGTGALSSITDNSSNWNTAYTHSQLTSGNPHSVTKTDLSLGNVENTALSTWAGSANMTTLGTIGTGIWNGTALTSGYVPNHDDLNGFVAGEHFTMLDEDNMVSNSATQAATQQSIKAYVDANSINISGTPTANTLTYWTNSNTIAHCTYAEYDDGDYGLKMYGLQIGANNGIGSGDWQCLAGGVYAFCNNDNTVAYGNYVRASGLGSLAGGKGYGVSDREIESDGEYAFNWSENTASQTNGHGALADVSAILGGRNNNIPTTDTGTVILGGNGIKATQKWTTYVENLDVNVNADITGDLTVTGDISYSSAKTGYVALTTIGVTTYAPDVDDIYKGNAATGVSSGTVSFYWELTLPHGATVTSCTVYGTATGKTWQLMRGDYNNGVTQLLTANVGSADSSPTFVVDNNSYNYLLQVASVGSGDGVLYGAKVTYTYTDL